MKPHRALFVGSDVPDAAAGLRIVASSSVEDALQRAACEVFDVVVFDLTQCELAAFATFRERCPKVATVVLAAGVDHGIRALEAGTGAYLLPGWSSEALVRAIEYAIERHATEEALRASERLYRNLVETTGDGIWTMDTAGLLAFVNPRIAEILGYSTEEMLGRRISEFVHPSSVPEVQKHIDVLRGGGREHFEFRGRRKDGGEVCALLSTSPLYDEAGVFTGAMAVITDITARVTAEQALREREVELAEAQRIARVGSWALDVAASEVRASEEGFRLFDLEPRTVVPSSEFRERIHEADRAIVETEIKSALESGQGGAEFRVVRGDGTVRVLRAIATVSERGAHPFVLVGTIQDITDRCRAEEVLLQHNERLARANRELERFNGLAVGRELRMIELKRQVNDLCEEMGRPPLHVLPDEQQIRMETYEESSPGVDASPEVPEWHPGA